MIRGFSLSALLAYPQLSLCRSSLESQRAWIVEQMSALLKKGSIPKSEETTTHILLWLATNAMFTVNKSPKKTENPAVCALFILPLSY